MTETSAPVCISCRGNELTVSYEYKYSDKSDYFQRYFAKLSILKCSSCGLLQIDHSKIDHEHLYRYYQEIYRQKAQFGVADSDNHIHFLQARARALTELAALYTSTNEVKRIFEMGAGYGYNLMEMGKRFPSAKLYTDEVDAVIDTVENIQKSNLDDHKFEIILFSHTLEHLINPAEYMKTALGQLAPGGVLVIEVPNETPGFLMAQKYHEPHLTFFQKETIAGFFVNQFPARVEILHVGTAGPGMGLWKARESAKGLKNRFPLAHRLLKKVYRMIFRERLNLSNDSGAGDRAYLRLVLRNRS